MTYPMTPEDGSNEDVDSFDNDVLERVQQLAEDNPIPDELRKQIEDWIEPQTVHTETDHEGAMDAVKIAYPLILAWHAGQDGVEQVQAGSTVLAEDAGFPPTPEIVRQIVADIKAKIGSWGVSQLGNGMADEIWDVWPSFQTLTKEQQEIVDGLVGSEMFGY